MALAQDRFKKVVRSLNRRVRFPLPLPGSILRRTMLYLYSPEDPGCDERGLVEILAYPSPRCIKRIPKWDWIDADGERSRGYTTIFKMLVRSKIIKDTGALRRMVPDALSPTNGRPEVKREDPNEPKGPLVPMYAYDGSRIDLGHLH